MMRKGKLIAKRFVIFLLVIVQVLVLTLTACKKKETEPNPSPSPSPTAPPDTSDPVAYDPAKLMKTNPVVEGVLSNNPVNYKMKDWNKTAKDFVEYVFDPTKRENATYPILYYATGYNLKAYFGPNETYGTDASGNPIVNQTFVIPSYYGDERAMESFTGDKANGEGVTAIGAVLTGAMMGYDMTAFPVGAGKVNYVKMLVEFFHAANGENVISNNSDSFLGQSFWYDVLPSVLFHELASYYPNETYLNDVMIQDANTWANVVDGLGGENADFNHTSYSIDLDVPTDNGVWTEPDAAAGIGLILYNTAKMEMRKGSNKDQNLVDKYLQRARWCMDFLNKQENNVLYESLAYYAPYLAAMMNAELGTKYDVEKMIGWAFSNDSVARPSWGMLTSDMAGYGARGLMGGAFQFGGYAFALGTFHATSCFTALLRYDGRYAKTVGKYVLNAASSARLFYGSEVPAENQTCYEEGKKDNIYDFIGYEAVAKNRGDGVSPNVSGDPLAIPWTYVKTDIGLYGSAMVGAYGAVISTTNVEKILRLDVTASDSYGEKNYPTYSYYNPYSESKTVKYNVGQTATDLYDLLSGEYVAKDVTGETEFTLGAEGSKMIVAVPAGAEKTVQDGKVLFAGKFAGTVMVNSVSIVGVQANERLRGTKQISVNAMYTDKDNAPTAMKIAFDGETYYDGLYKTAYQIDTTKVQNGIKRLSVTVTFKNGATDFSTVKVKVDNQKGPDVFKYTAEEIANFQPVGVFPADAELKDGVAVIKTREGWLDPNSGDKPIYWGAVASPLNLVDLYRYPQLEIEITDIGFEFAIQFHVDGELWGEYLIANVSNTGTYTIDIRSALASYAPLFAYHGVQNVEIWLLSVGSEKANPYTTLSVKSMRMYYMHEQAWEENGAFEWGDTVTPGKLYRWENDSNFPASLSYEDGKAVIQSTSKAMGGVVSDWVTVDFDNLPTMELELGKASYTYLVRMYTEDGKEYFATLATAVDGDTVTVIDLIENFKTTAPGVAFTGEKKVKFGIYASGGHAGENDAVMRVGAIKTYYGKYPAWGEELPMKDIVKWRSAIHAGSVKLSDGKAVIKANGTYGGIGSKFKIDFDKTPILKLNVSAMNGQSYFLQMHFEGETSARYFYDNGAEGETTIDIKAKLQSMHKPEEPELPDLTGVQTVRIYFCVVGQVAGSTFTVSSIETSYSDGPVQSDNAWGASFAPTDIAGWGASVHGGSAAVSGTDAVISPATSGYGGVSKDLEVDLSRHPMIKFTGAQTEGGWFVQIKFTGDANARYFYDKGDKGTVVIDLLAGLKEKGEVANMPAGKVTGSLQICANGGKPLTVSSIATYYQDATAEDITKWEPAYNGSATAAGGVASILPGAGQEYGGVYRVFDLDFDKNPIVMVKGAQASGAWAMLVKIGTDAEKYFYNAGGNGLITADLKAGLKTIGGVSVPPTGIQTVQIWIITQSANPVKLTGTDVYYTGAAEAQTWTAEQVAGLGPAHGGSASLAGDKATIAPHPVNGYGGITTQIFSMDFDRTSVLTLQDVEANGAWFIQVVVDGVATYVYNGVAISDGQTVTVDLLAGWAAINAGATLPTGKHNVQINICANSGCTALTVSGMALTYSA